jgi:hypothetical protein
LTICLLHVLFITGDVKPKIQIHLRVMSATNEEILKASAEIERLVRPTTTAAAVDPAELCKVYNSIKGPLGILLPIIKAIPIYGAAVAAGLQLLMGIANKLCPVK